MVAKIISGKSIRGKLHYNENKVSESKAQILLSLKNGNRPLITTMKDGQEVKLRIEAVPRYGQINMFAENGKPEKREQFLKETQLEKSTVQGKSRSKDKELSESQGMGI